MDYHFKDKLNKYINTGLSIVIISELENIEEYKKYILENNLMSEIINEEKEKITFSLYEEQVIIIRTNFNFQNDEYLIIDCKNEMKINNTETVLEFFEILKEQNNINEYQSIFNEELKLVDSKLIKIRMCQNEYFNK